MGRTQFWPPALISILDTRVHFGFLSLWFESSSLGGMWRTFGSSKPHFALKINESDSHTVRRDKPSCEFETDWTCNSLIWLDSEPGRNKPKEISLVGRKRTSCRFYNTTKQVLRSKCMSFLQTLTCFFLTSWTRTFSGPSSRTTPTRSMSGSGTPCLP